MNPSLVHITGASAVIFLTILSVGLFIYAWRRRLRGDLRYFVWMLGASTIWQLTAVLSFLSPTPATADFLLANVKFVAVAAVPVTFLALTLRFTGQARWLKPRNIALLCVIPVATQIMTWTDSPLFITDRMFEQHGPYLIEVSQQLHAWFWVHTTYSYGLAALSLVLLLRFAHRSQSPYNARAMVLVIGATTVFLANALTLFNVLLPEPPEFTAMTFGGLNFVWAWALFRHGLLDSMPVARDTIFEGMVDAVLVLDLRNRVVDLNPAARDLIGSNASTVIGSSIREVWPRQTELFDRYSTAKETQTEIVVSQGAEERAFDLSISTFYRRQSQAGRLVVLRDITERKQAADRLRAMNTQLEQQLAEIQSLQEALMEQAIRDPLTELYNRGYFEDALRKSRGRLERTGECFGLVMIDVDDFKEVNDAYGHPVGDEVLRSLSAVLTVDTRHEDSVCRYGGDEFIIVLPRIDQRSALDRAENWRARFEATQFIVDETPITVTLSIGVAVFSEATQNLDEMLGCLDQALYKSKLAGRNRVTAYDW